MCKTSSPCIPYIPQWQWLLFGGGSSPEFSNLSYMEFDFVGNFHLWLYMVTITDTYTAPSVDEILFKHFTIINFLEQK